MLQTIDTEKVATSNWWASMLGPLGVYIYVASFVFPVKWDLPMIVLVAAGMLSTLYGTKSKTFAKPHNISLALTIFLALMGVSILTSSNFSRSFGTSVTFLPALLIYFLITDQFASEDKLRLLYLCCSVTALGISIAGLCIAAANHFKVTGGGNVHVLAGSFSYIIVSRNDLIFLSLMAPFSSILAYRRPFSAMGVTAIFSMVLSLCAVVVFQSRGATLIFLITLSCVAFLLEPRKALWLSILFFLIFLVTDAFLGFALLDRFYGILIGSDDLTNGRTRLWGLVWNHFKEAPLLGHGPHTFGLFNKTPWPHNLYLEVLFGHGLAGFSAIGALMFCAGKTAWNLLKAASVETRDFAVGVSACLVGFGISAFFELSFLRLWVTVTLFMILGIIVRLSATEKTHIKEE